MFAPLAPGDCSDSSDSAASGCAKRCDRTAALPRSRSLHLRSWSSSTAGACRAASDAPASRECGRLRRSPRGACRTRCSRAGAARAHTPPSPWQSRSLRAVDRRARRSSLGSVCLGAGRAMVAVSVLVEHVLDRPRHAARVRRRLEPAPDRVIAVRLMRLRRPWCDGASSSGPRPWRGRLPCSFRGASSAARCGPRGRPFAASPAPRRSPARPRRPAGA